MGPPRLAVMKACGDSLSTPMFLNYFYRYINFHSFNIGQG